jgi:ribosomal protein S18 acetylase RimI-like enzyme
VSVTIKPAQLDDPQHQQQLVDLLDMYCGDVMGSQQALPDEVRSRLIDGLRAQAGSLALIAYLAGRPVGLCICFQGFSTFQARPLLNIHDLAVHPDYRNRGIGRALLQRVTDIARARDCCKLTLEVRTDNPAAQRLYRSCGFDELSPVMHFWNKPL